MTLKQKLDSIFAKYIIKRDGKCFTCGATYDLQCGHFIHRTILSLRYDEKNCQCQCKLCNCFCGGDEKNFARLLKEKYGEDIVEYLREKKRTHLQLRDADYLELIEVYKQKLKDLGC